MRSILLIVLLAALSLAGPADAGREADRLYEAAVRQHGAGRLEDRFARYARAAEAGHPVAQYNVAMMYANGEAVNVDYQQSVYWFRKSADQRFAPAMHRLGELYFFGMGGLMRDERSAARLFEAAAQQGDADACMNLAMLVGAEDAPEAGRLQPLLDCAEQGGNEWAEYYRMELEVSPDGRFSEADRRGYWARQKGYWVEMAAQFGVREAEEAVDGDGSDPR
jgi:TPR repeat protein